MITRILLMTDDISNVRLSKFQRDDGGYCGLRIDRRGCQYSVVDRSWPEKDAKIPEEAYNRILRAIQGREGYVEIYV